MLRAKNVGGGSIDEMPTMRPVSMGRPLVTMSTYEERGETLKRTSIMPDDSCYRSNSTSNNNNNNNSSSSSNNHNNNGNNGSNRLALLNGNNNSNNDVNSTPDLPPPPPQFANPQQQQQPPQSPLKTISNGNGNVVGQQSMAARSKQLLSPVRSPSINVGGLRAPATPQPDYEAASSVQLRSNGQPATANGSQQLQQQQQRRTLRLGTVTIGEYGEQRAKRETLRKMPSIGSGNGNGGNSNNNTNTNSAHTNGILKNGSRSSASFSSSSNNNNNNNSSSSNISNGRHQLQQSEKSIKFGN